MCGADCCVLAGFPFSRAPLYPPPRPDSRYRYRKRHEAEEGGNGGGGGGVDQRHGERGAPARDGDGERRGKDCATELTAVAAVTAAAKAVEAELRAQLEAKDEALR